MYKKILLAMDQSDLAYKAAEKVIELQKLYQCEVVIFHSVCHHSNLYLVPYATPIGPYLALTNDLEADCIRTGQKLLSKMDTIFRNAHLEIETRLILHEDPEYYINRMVAEEGFDLVVIGSKGIHSKLSNLFIGSITTDVIKHAPCDILIIK